MSHARIEEVSSSDPEVSDPSEGNISDVASDFDERDILKRRDVPSTSHSKSTDSQSVSDPIRSSHINPSHIPMMASSPSPQGTQFRSTEDESKYKDFQCIYPVYFDQRRSRKEGRRVGVEQAVENPLARTIVDACGALGLETLFEPAKVHPKDWANPGRVTVRVKGGGGPVKNKHHLYTLISRHLLANPTTAESALRIRVPGMPPPDPSKPYPKPAIPKGWKMGTILPYYGSAISGGGVSENFFKDMMAEMQGQGGMPGMPGGGMPGMMNGMLGGLGGGAGAGGGQSSGGSKKDKGKGRKTKT